MPALSRMQRPVHPFRAVPHFAFLHHLHIHAQYIDRAARLADNLRESIASLSLYADTQASLYARSGAPGRHYLLVEGRSLWLQRFFAVPHCPQLSGVIAIVTDRPGSAERSKLLLADADMCLPGSALPREIVAALSALARMEQRLAIAANRAEG
ncbi:hypothetical protein HGQ98_06065 [Achromobacter ruhlandii]|uniref:Uncharacterized protein n=2 Tax=Achromobacter ruhlandii TaxID=72557 RepID=A0A848NA85_9BURK|nr:hypothetical protein [Achromobacter ruhlandii]NMU89438.1 hypothetical protein [Achromobacter ruhlandii]